MRRFLVSACLAGERCRYDGQDNTVPEIAKLAAQGLLVPVCPEVLGGLSVPRTPCEIVNGRVVGRDGRDYDDEFRHGARLALAAGQGCARAALLKARSPSCGSGVIYDGTFSHVRIPGDGVFAALLKDSGFAIFSEEDLDALSDDEILTRLEAASNREGGN